MHQPESTPPPAARGFSLRLRSTLVVGFLLTTLLVLWAAMVLDSSLWIEVSMAATAVVLMFGAARRCPALEKRSREAWLLLGVAYLMFASGDLCSALGVELTEGVGAIVMNGFYLAFYPLFMLGVMRLPPVPMSRADRFRLAMDTLMVVLSVGVALWVLLIRPLALAHTPFNPKLGLTAAFLAGDLMMVTAVLTLLFGRHVRSAFSVTVLLAVAALVQVGADIVYAIQILGELQGLVTRWTSFFFSLSYLLAATAALVAILLAGRQSGPEIEQHARHPRGRLGLSLLVAYAALTGAWLSHYSGHLDSGVSAELGLLLLIIILVAARQIYELNENQRLLSEVSQARDELEERVRARTRELETANVALAKVRDGLEDTVAARTAELERANRRLQDANRELESFSYSVSHDLRAPLRSVDGFSALLAADHASQLDDQAQDFLSRIRASSQHMSQLIDDLLRLSRLSRAELSLVHVDLHSLIHEVMEPMLGAAPEREVELVVEQGLALRGDSRLMRVALENLLSNAVKFTAEQATARIELGSRRGEGETVYFVRDNGVGFEMKHADKLFSPFFRVHDEERFAGTGIGLATVKRIIHRHGGRIWAEAAPGKGATFFFTVGASE